MGLSAFYTSSRERTEAEKIEVFKAAYDSGCTLFNTATFYGPLHEEGFGENLRLLNKCLQLVDRSQIQIMCKIGMDTRAPVTAPATQWNLSGKEEALRADVNYALKTLGVDYIDIIVMCRVPSDAPIEDVMKTMVAIVNEGKAKHIGLSEASAEIIRRACAVAPLYCIEQEYSLWARDIEAEIIPVCRELGVKIVAYCPLGRGFLTGTIVSRSNNGMDPYDYRMMAQPRFNEENFAKNLALVERLREIATIKGITLSQLSLAWLHSQGSDIIPIPGTSSIDHLNENMAAYNVTLEAHEVLALNDIFAVDAPAGDRYPTVHLTFRGGGNIGAAAH